MKRQKVATRKVLVLNKRQIDVAISIIRGLPIDPSNPIEIRIGERVMTRNNDQNALMWAGPLRNISEQVWIDGRQYSSETWHEHFKREFLPEEADIDLTKEGYQKWVYLPSGERILKASTGDLTTKGFSLYLEQIYAFGSQHGVRFGVSERMFV